MVVIEPAVTEERSDVASNPSSSPPGDSDKERTTSSASNRDASDGFETASDGEFADLDNEGEKGNAAVQESEERKEEEKSDEESKQQKAMEEANDAKLQGNNLFGNGQYEEALKQYELALHATADIPSSVELRSICHANRAICFLKLAKYEDTIKECTKALELNPSYLKALIRRGEAHEKLENFEEAIADMKKILELDPSNDQARKGIRRMEPLAAEKREKMKEEMIGKLKEMGNSILGRFGMSIDNFKTVKDPKTGSYSVQFQS